MTLGINAGATLVPSALGDFLIGSADNDVLDIVTGIVGLIGMGGDDSLTGGAGSDYLFGDFYDVRLMDRVVRFDGSMHGRDVLTGGNGDDYLDGGRGNDLLFGGKGNDHFILGEASPGNDRFRGGAGADVLEVYDLWGKGLSYAEVNRLILNTDASVETVLFGMDLRGTAKADVFDLSGVTQYLDYDSGAPMTPRFALLGAADKFTGSNLAEIIDGGGAQDTLNGNGGDDTLHGGSLNDLLTGGAGRDAFVFDTWLGEPNVDTITDFAPGQDRIELDHANPFDTLAPGALASAQFKVLTPGGAETIDADDRIVYVLSSGQLFYAPQGNLGPLLNFATLAAGTALAATDFVIF